MRADQAVENLLDGHEVAPYTPPSTRGWGGGVDPVRRLQEILLARAHGAFLGHPLEQQEAAAVGPHPHPAKTGGGAAAANATSARKPRAGMGTVSPDVAAPAH